MNFFEHQAQARAHSNWLVVLFALSVLLIVAAVDVVVLGALVAQQRHVAADAGFWQLARQFSGALTVASFITLAIILLSSLYKVSALGKGGAVVAKSLGAQAIAGSQDPRYRRLRNVIEEIAIASGVPVPQIFVLEQEPGINAFAAGYTPADAAITVTRGALDKLSRDELQGVIAHEFSHIVNGDMRLSIRLMGVIFGIIVIALLARIVLRGAGNSRGKGAGGIVAAALAVMIIGYIGVFFARLIKAGFSRERESLADASAVQFTRQTVGLAGALKKIAGLEAGSKFQVTEAEEVSHMLFGEGQGFSLLFATHPPLLERIRALEPTFKLEQITQQAKAWNEPSFVAEDLQPAIAGFSAAGGAAAPAQVAAKIGTPAPEHYRYGEATRAGLPQALKDLARDPAQARELLLAMLLDPDDAIRTRQRAVLRARLGAAASAVEAIEPKLAGLGPALRLPLAAIAFPALRQRPRDELMQLVLTVSELSHADGGANLFEFCLGCMLRTQVADTLNPAKARVAGKLKLPECEGEVLQLLNALAQQGSEDPAVARRAFAAGLAHLQPRSPAAFQPRSDWAASLHMALLKLDRLCGPAKELLLEGMLKTIQHDGRLTTGEAELFRATCAALHCPLPPLLDAGSGPQ